MNEIHLEIHRHIQDSLGDYSTLPPAPLRAFYALSPLSIGTYDGE